MMIKKLKTYIIITFILYFLYVISAILRFDNWANILSPFVGFLSFVVIIRNYQDIRRKRRDSYKFIWLLFGHACISWAMADMLWAFYYYMPFFTPEKSILLTCLYTLPNIFICAAVVLYGYHLMKKWNSLQLLLDSCSIALSLIFLFWIIYFHKDLNLYQILSNDRIINFVNINIDIIMIVSISIWYISVRKGKIPVHLKVIACTSLMFCLIDLQYYHIYFSHTYNPNSMIDIIYLGSFAGISAGAFLEFKYRNSDTKSTGLELVYNVGFTRKHLLLLVCPVLAFAYEGFIIRDLLFFLTIIIIHHILGNYVKLYIDNEQLLIKEKKMNQILEEKIEERTKEIIEKNKQLEDKNEELNFLSKQDTVTALYNRRYFLESLEEKLKTIGERETLAIIFIDIDRFKTINDMYGHHIGDKVLIEIAKRLQSFSGEHSFLARLGGDEFVMCFHGRYGYANMERISNDIINKCSKELEVEQYVFHLTVSIGISIYPSDAKDRSTLMRNADIAMYQAKLLGKNRCVSFDLKYIEKLSRKSDIEYHLKRLQYEEELQVYYQPQFRITDKKLIGAEALLRWNNKELGWVTPSEFIPVAEELNIISSIGEWVMEKAVKQIGLWNRTYDSRLKMGINVSPKQLDHKTFVPNLKKVMEESSVPSEAIDIEITESLAIEGEERIEQIESIFHSLGISISIDDFGTGYSSLSYLKFFPFERIKIAKPLIDTISTDHYDLQIVKAVIMLAKSLGIKTIAEGVESQEQFDILAALGCDEIQGYFLGRPVPSGQFEELFLKTSNTKTAC
ncbi:putative bifunctional diguanylate cyclase/phosphodiesterase [Anaerocolumna sp. MB42-C2]|uniref:putative bifunctional diguanylate cyclase/phosphodiesterase n=1 Tax=Anaerocolumna sp. MB42-C2 TaxID=3070997 RepID=UPI0027E0B230|nr:EAL domain-containing protein [Anaerocolumna sp. MB42-C2]WMJ85871.1 EAL domain-containing protein [Anaerocolumna sp. MB42-C2]